MGVFFLFLLALAGGCLSTLFWIPEDDLGRGYFQTNALIVLGLLGLALTAYWLHPLAPFGDAGDAGSLQLGPAGLYLAVAGGFGYYAGVWRLRWPAARLAAAVALAGTGIALWVSAGALVRTLTPLPHRGLLLSAGLASSALVLGWSLITMLLGHWYLVAPRLSFRHLTVFCWVLLGAILLRGLAVGGTLAVASGVDPLIEPHPLRLLTGFSGEGMFFWFRLLWGLAIPLGLGVMSLHCARNRSNQSATGILYVLVVGCLIGEITAFYLTLATGVPV